MDVKSLHGLPSGLVQARLAHGVQILVELPLVQGVAEAVACERRLAKPLQTLGEDQPVLAAQLAAQVFDEACFALAQHDRQRLGVEGLALHAGRFQDDAAFR